jgi:LysR family glycine cleavage system transcriptional activator
LPVAFAYWIVCPEATAKLPKIVAFVNWLQAEAAEDVRQLEKLTSQGTTARRHRITQKGRV